MASMVSICLYISHSWIVYSSKFIDDAAPNPVYDTADNILTTPNTVYSIATAAGTVQNQNDTITTTPNIVYGVPELQKRHSYEEYEEYTYI